MLTEASGLLTRGPCFSIGAIACLIDSLEHFFQFLHLGDVLGYAHSHPEKHDRKQHQHTNPQRLEEDMLFRQTRQLAQKM